MNNLKNKKGDIVKLEFKEMYMDSMCFSIIDMKHNREVGELEVMDFPGFYSIACEANDNFAYLYGQDLDNRLYMFFTELKMAIIVGEYGLEDKPVYLQADDHIASRYAIVNCLERIPRYDGYYFIN